MWPFGCDPVNGCAIPCRAGSRQSSQVDAGSSLLREGQVTADGGEAAAGCARRIRWNSQPYKASTRNAFTGWRPPTQPPIAARTICRKVRIGTTIDTIRAGLSGSQAISATIRNRIEKSTRKVPRGSVGVECVRVPDAVGRGDVHALLAAVVGVDDVLQPEDALAGQEDRHDDHQHVEAREPQQDHTRAAPRTAHSHTSSLGLGDRRTILLPRLLRAKRKLARESASGTDQG